METRKCVVCGKEFQTYRQDRRYCSDACRKKATRAKKKEREKAEPQPAPKLRSHPRFGMHPKICAFCGKEFVALSAKGKYCSLECNNKAYLKRQFERRKKEHPEDVLVCPCCGKEFFRSKANPVYCSYVCKRKMEPPKPQPKRLSSKTTGYLAPKRKCHDCKRPTDNYRCPECWEKYRAKHAGDCFDL